MLHRWMQLMLATNLLLSPARASTISIVPVSVNGTPNQSFQFDVVASGFQPTTPLAGFDLEFIFDSSVSSYSATTFGGFLGDVSLGEAIPSVHLSSDSVELLEVSLLDSNQLSAIQPSTFTLATLKFTSSTEGFAPLLVAGQLSDPDGNPIESSFQQAGTVVPEASTLHQLFVGLLSLFIFTFVRRPVPERL